jgi:hypothetical protein
MRQRKRKRTARLEPPTRLPFVAAIHWIGIALISTFLLWTITLVVMQAADQRHR